MKTLLILPLWFPFLLYAQEKHPTPQMKNERYEIGWKKLAEIDGEAGEKVIESLKDISPDLANYIIEYAFGDIYPRTSLDLKSKEIAVVAALTAMGNAQPQLIVHLNAALNVGCSITEIQEVILQMSAYAGFPAAINGMLAFKKVAAERPGKGTKDQNVDKEPKNPQDKTRYEIGLQQLSVLNKDQAKLLEDTFEGISPSLARYAIEYGYADIASRPGLSTRYRQIATIAALAALGNAQPQLRFHIEASLKIGVTKEEIAEIMILMSVYAGFPAAINGTMVLKEVAHETGD